MHSYDWNIGDYRKDTQHLTHLEHGIYRALLDTYYLQEGPFTEDLNTIMRKHCIRTQDEVRAFMRVVEDFFYHEPCGYLVHNGCKKRLQAIYKRSESARKNAEKRWQAKMDREKFSQGETHQLQLIDCEKESEG